MDDQQPDETERPRRTAEPAVGAEGARRPRRRDRARGVHVVGQLEVVADDRASSIASASTSTTAPRDPQARDRSRTRRSPEGTDTMPQIEHIVVLMMENHSYDDHFGMLKRGDGFKLGSDGLPLDANLYTDGKLLKAFHMPSTCQLDAHPGQDWNASHTSFNNGRNDGFVKGSGPVAMGYWDEHRHPLLLRARGDLPGRRSLLLLGAGADLPEPPLPRRGHRGRHHQHDAPTRCSRRLRRTARSSTGSTRTASRGATTTTTCRRARR